MLKSLRIVSLIISILLFFIFLILILGLFLEKEKLNSNSLELNASIGFLMNFILALGIIFLVFFIRKEYKKTSDISDGEAQTPVGPIYRFVASAVDGLIFYVGCIVVANIFKNVASVVIFMIIFVFVYQSLFLSYFGKTIPMSLIGTSARKENGKKLNYFEALLRTYLKYSLSLGVTGAISLFIIISTKQKLSLPDVLVNSTITYDKKPDSFKKNLETLLPPKYDLK